MNKKKGILLPIFSLPSDSGIGTFGASAYTFVDFLYLTGCDYWQVLPLSPTAYGNSPYQSPSVMAINPLFIDFAKLVQEGLILASDYKELSDMSNARVDYDNVGIIKLAVLQKVFNNRPKEDFEFVTFCHEQASWLDDYALFVILKRYHNNDSWQKWDEYYKTRQPLALQTFIKNHYDAIECEKYIQYLAYQQWQKLKKYANEHQIQIIGDMPIYPAIDSIDVWAHPELFELDSDLQPIQVAGCPPDYFSEDGQLWGNPLYDWPQMAKTNYSWWIERLQWNIELYDIVRIDHFRGFSKYYAIPYGSVNARNGAWRKGPGFQLFKVLKQAVPNANILAENLGSLDGAVTRLMNACQFPGMKVLQFVLEDAKEWQSLKHPKFYNDFLYTGTHDNPLLKEWYATFDPQLKVVLAERIGDANIVEQLIRLALQSNYANVIIPLGDFLEKGSEGRINTPSTIGVNWQWRLLTSELNDELLIKVKRLMNEADE